MSKYLGTYRGADLYEADESYSSKDKLLQSKVWAYGVHPRMKNLKVDFIQEGPNRYKALRKLIEQIDHYLELHEFEEFESKKQ